MQLTLDYQNMDASYKGKAKGNQKCLEQFEKFRVGAWAKTYANLLIGQEGWYSMTCNLTWKLRSTKSHRFYFHLFPSYQHTESMLPTPRAQEPGRTSEGYGASLTDIVMGYKMLPTPIAGDWKGQLRSDGTASMLSGKASLGMLPTPRSRDYKGDRKLKNGKNITSNGEEMALTLEQVARIITHTQETLSKNSQLSPQFVMEMMGFPANWTLLPFLNKEICN